MSKKKKKIAGDKGILHIFIICKKIQLGYLQCYYMPSLVPHALAIPVALPVI